MSTWKVRLSLALNFFVFAILLNTVGIVIREVIADYGVSRVTAASLEGFKDITIAVASFLLASYVPRFGYRRSMLVGLLVVTLASILVAAVTGFWVTPVLYMAVGASFALMKTSVYSTIGLITRTQGEHTGLMNVLEGIFQVGAMTGPLFFSFMISVSHWNQTYWIIAGLTSLALLLLLVTPLDESEIEAHPEQAGFVEMIKLLKLPMVWVFVICAWLYVMIEQSFGTWLPTFNNEVFGLSASQAAGFLSIYAGSIALSRFLAGYLSKHIPWLPMQLTLLAAAFALTLTVVLATADWQAASFEAWYQAPPLAFVFSMMGFFIGPIYPTISSIVLNKLAKARHSAMTGLIIIFSALGGTTGSLLLGFFSQKFNTHDAFFWPLVPIVLLGLALIPYKRLSDRHVPETL